MADSSPPATPRLKLARALYLTNFHATEESWIAALSWHEAEMAKDGEGDAYHSHVGTCLRKADAALRWIKAAGLVVEAAPE